MLNNSCGTLLAPSKAFTNKMIPLYKLDFIIWKDV